MDQKLNHATEQTRKTIDRAVYILMWTATIVQAALIVTQMVINTWASPLGLGLLGIAPAEPLLKIHATEYSTAAYLIFLLAYVGRKEFARWTKAPIKALSGTGSSALTDDEMMHRLRKGEAALFLWGFLMIAGALFYSLALLSKFPDQLLLTCCQVVAIWVCGAYSGMKKEAKDRKDERTLPASRQKASVSETAPVGNDDGTDELDNRITAFLASREDASLSDLLTTLKISRSTLQYRLRNLLASGAITREGSARATRYKTIGEK